MLIMLDALKTALERACEPILSAVGVRCPSFLLAYLVISANYSGLGWNSSGLPNN